jgi:DnaJ like chaperone protein
MNFRNMLGRIFGSGIGLLGAGFWGGLVGFGVGAIIDKLHKEGLLLWDSGPSSEDTNPTDFILSSLVLASAVIKSDGKIDDLELSYVNTFLIDQFGKDNIHEYIGIMERAMKSKWDLRKVTQQVRQSTSYETRLQLLYFLFGIANADFNIDDKEIATIKIISIHLGLSTNDHDSIKAMFYHEMDAFYKILEVLPSASDITIKEAYHKMAIKYHPDKVGHLGDAVKIAAKEKFQKVQYAYDTIKSKRGFK